jgi:hypothetical protein
MASAWARCAGGGGATDESGKCERRKIHKPDDYQQLERAPRTAISAAVALLVLPTVIVMTTETNDRSDRREGYGVTDGVCEGDRDCVGEAVRVCDGDGDAEGGTGEREREGSRVKLGVGLALVDGVSVRVRPDVTVCVGETAVRKDKRRREWCTHAVPRLWGRSTRFTTPKHNSHDSQLPSTIVYCSNIR